MAEQGSKPPSDPPVPAPAQAAPQRRKGDTEAYDETIPSLDPDQLAGLSSVAVDDSSGAMLPVDSDALDRAVREGKPLGDQLKGVVLAERYRLDFELGRGGMGSVWVAEHLTLRVPVAVKVMLADVAQNNSAARRFRREARAMSCLRHRNIVTVMDYGVEGNRPFIVMEYLRGQDLADWQEGLGRLPTLDEIAFLMAPLLDAFEAAHGAGIIHRDLKPENVFLAEEGDGQRVVKVLDFGLARMDDPTDNVKLTKENWVSGTPLYMSPEQCRSLAVGPSTDIYALGCILTELLQGEPPFMGRSPADVMTQQMFSAPPPLNRPADAEPVPPLLERLRVDLLAKRPELRPVNIADLRARLDEALDPEKAARRLPARKLTPPLGGRAERVPAWTNPDPHITDAPVGQLTGKVAVLRLAELESGLNDPSIVGLSTAGLKLLLLKSAEDGPRDANLVVLDAGHDIAGACTWLTTHTAESGPSVIVCAAEPRGETLKQLIAAGAAEVAPYPVEIGRLLRMVRRLLRRQQRRR